MALLIPTHQSGRVPLTLRDLFWSDPFFSSICNDLHQVQENLLCSKKKSSANCPCKMRKTEKKSSPEVEPTSNQAKDGNASEIKKKSSANCPCKMRKIEKKSTSEVEPTSNQDKDGNASEIKKKSSANCPCKMRKIEKKSTSEVEPTSNQDKDGNSIALQAKSNNQDQSDRQLVHIQDSEDKLTISLDVHQFKPEEIQISIKDGYVNVEAKHEDKSEDGNMFSSTHFVRRYPLPKNAKQEAVVSNLSSDGILAITAPKIKELKNDSEIKVPITMSS